MNNLDEWIVVGRFGRPQGLKGFVRVNSFTEPEQSILTYVPWHMKQDGLWVPISLESTAMQNNVILAQVTGYTQREQAAKLTHIEIGIAATQLPRLTAGEYYWQEILHMQVYLTDGKLLGEVVDIMPTGSNDVLIVQGSRRHLIPFITDTYIMSVDSAQRRIIVDWDEHF